MKGLWLVFLTATQAVSLLQETPGLPNDQEAAQTASYFIPISPAFFNTWRSLILAETIHETLSDPWEFHLHQVEQVVRPFLMKPVTRLTIADTVTDPAYREAVKRSIYSLRILYDLGLLTSPVETSGVREKSFNADSIIMTFRMRIPRYHLAWQSLKLIAENSDIRIATLVEFVAKVGESDNTKWMRRILGWE